MTTEELKSKISATPFQPFAIRLADGRAIKIPHPEYIAVHPTGRTAHVFDNKGGHEVIDIMLTVSLEVPARLGKKTK